jgi:hypothetical protein
LANVAFCFYGRSRTAQLVALAPRSIA